MSLARKDAILAWHFLPENGCLANTGRKRKVEAGVTYSVRPPIVACERGLHGSIRPIDALKYAPGPIACRTLHWGEVVHHDSDKCEVVHHDGDKLASQHRRVLWLADATTTLHAFACDAAEETLDLVEGRGMAVDPRSRTAIEVKRRWLRGEATAEELAAASAAAMAAAMATAWSAACSAALAAASAAAMAAAHAAARATAWASQNSRLEAVLLALAPKEVQP